MLTQIVRPMVRTQVRLLANCHSTRLTLIHTIAKWLGFLGVKAEVTELDASLQIFREFENRGKETLVFPSFVVGAAHLSSDLSAASFASDDEIGFFFKTVKDIQKVLNEFQLKKLKD